MSSTTDRVGSRRFRPSNLISHIALLVGTFLTLAPLAWMVGISFQSPNAIGALQLVPWPSSPTMANYFAAFSASDIPLQFVNSLIFSLGVTLGLLIVSIPTAYGLARWKLRGGRLIVAATLIGLSVPFIVTYLPNFLMVSRLHLLNTYPGLIVPHIANAYGILLLTQRFRSIPASMLEAAQMDGANSWRVLTRIVIPTMTAPIAAVGLFVFISTWNELVWPQLVGSDASKYVLSVGLTQFSSQEAGINYGPLMAAAVITAIPTVILYVLFRRRVLGVVLDGGSR